MHTKSRYTCGASLIDVGVVCYVVATGVVMMDRPVKKRSGTEPPFVPPPKHSAGNLVVSMVSRFTERDLNTPGPIRDTYVDTMQLAPVRLPNLATTPTVSGLAAISHFPVCRHCWYIQSIQSTTLKPRRRCHPARTAFAAELAVAHDPASRGFAKAAQNGVEEPNVNDTRLSNLAGGSGTVEVTILQLVTPALTRCSAMLNVGATVVDLVRIEIQKCRHP